MLLHSIRALEMVGDGLGGHFGVMEFVHNCAYFNGNRGHVTSIPCAKRRPFLFVLV